MLELGRFEDTGYYKSVAAEVGLKVKITSLREQIERLERYYRDGNLMESFYQSEMAEFKTRLSELEQTVSPAR